MLDLLWIPLLEAHQTGGLFSVTEQLMPKDSGAHTKHVHNVDEWFYVLDGTVDVELEDETSSGQPFLAHEPDDVICEIASGITDSGDKAFADHDPPVELGVEEHHDARRERGVDFSITEATGGAFTAQITRGDAEALALREGDTVYVRATRVPPIAAKDQTTVTSA